jgi:hypothetical protein
MDSPTTGVPDPRLLSQRLHDLETGDGTDSGWTDVGRQLARLAAAMSRTASNRRRAPRVPVRCRAWCKEKGLRLLVQVLNASSTGLCVRAPSALGVGAKVMVTFKLDPTIEVAAEARVVWVARTGALSGMGLELLEFARPEVRGPYEAFLAQRLVRA